ncbi:acyltransferase domain-containing protein, partial [Saccharothrix sp. NRRL B-16314]|uniref:acyltransferase domain-containing protein n=1 Tax=Saccharothrix sp. NRRL B-16314 TaxID=1463825 RepID=UPI001E60923C
MAGLVAVADGRVGVGRPGEGVVVGRVTGAGRVGMVFPGQGAQWAGMAVELLDTVPVFASRIADCARALDPYLDWSLTDVLRGVDGAPDLDRVDVVQPVLFAVMVSLAAVWESFGIEPAGVVGHSQGEIAAACVAGALSLDDGARIVATRSRLLFEHTSNADGAMLSVVASEAEVRAHLSTLEDAASVSVSAVNGPRSTVVAGDSDTIERFERVL